MAHYPIHGIATSNNLNGFKQTLVIWVQIQKPQTTEANTVYASSTAFQPTFGTTSTLYPLDLEIYAPSQPLPVLGKVMAVVPDPPHLTTAVITSTTIPPLHLPLVIKVWGLESGMAVHVSFYLFASKENQEFENCPRILWDLLEFILPSSHLSSGFKLAT
ncbi:hypothetical protein BYT27DRAFT_7210246 [Phlegmacium glaucopus]|nr:hypothetical protein BYT27DRAFT_7210246 [Phlegmacium glaucopus]